MCAFKSTPPTRQRAHREYEFTQKLGEGSFGAVYLAKVGGTKKKMVAVKMCDASTHTTKRELFILETIKKSEVKCKFLAEYSESYEREAKLFIVMELMQTTLWHVIDKEEDKIPLHAIRVVSKQILLGLSALHSIGIVHNDLKPDNVMLVNHEKYPYQVKLIDFGGAVHKDFEGGAPRYVQAQAYMAPEANIKNIVGPKSDMWAHAAILLEMVLNRAFFEAYSPTEATYQHFQMMGQPSMSFRNMMGNQFKEHFKHTLVTKTIIPIFYDEKTDRKRKDNQPETLEGIYTSLLAEGDNKEDVKYFDELLRKILTWDPNDRISVDDALECDWLNPDRFEDQKYAKEAKSYYRKARLEMPTRKRKIEMEDDKENKRPAN